MLHSKVKSAAVVAAISAAGLFATATPATAAAVSPGSVCGSGYSVIDSHDLGAATVYLTYNSSNGYNCVTTIRDTSGSAIYMEASIRKSGGSWVSDGGSYATYAGPVYVNAPSTCIQWGGMYGQIHWQSGLEHCG
ncbi:spore-associated protein A [Streptomyces clavifer]|uniref:spore-associated protein A n=1 Tax=Streptomyces clavifer TaxID=68188 RepID=UPI003698CC77